MKFESQVASYQSKLRRRSRFFSSLMLASGISLAAAAPFLSYEVSQIECVEKGSVVTQDFSEEVETLKSELEGKDKTITQLEEKVEIKDKEIRDLSSNPDCDNIVRVLEEDINRLDAELADATTASDEKDKDISDLAEQLAECEKQDNQSNTTKPNCDKYTKLISTLRTTIVTKDKIIEKLESAPAETVECPGIRLSGMFRNNESFAFGRDQFRVTINSDDVGARYGLIHNKVSRKIQYANKVGSYTFTDRNKNRYKISFGNVSKGGLPYTLISL